MDIRDYLLVLRNRWMLIVILVITGGLAAQGVTLLTTPRYQATSQLFVVVQGNDSVVDLNQGNAFAQSRVSSYVVLATSPKVLHEVGDKLHIDPGVIAAELAATNPAKTVLIDITATNENAVQAAKIANAVADALVELVGTVETTDQTEANNAPVSLKKVQDATVPGAPFEPSMSRNLAIGVLLGLLVGIGSALLIELLDTRLRGRQAIEKITDASVLGTFATEASGSNTLVLQTSESYSHRTESFRQLRTHLQFANVDGGLQSILVTSSVPGEGKSTTAANLAIVLAESANRVLLVDADLRRPTINGLLGLEGTVGLTTVLTGRVPLEEATQSVSGTAGLSVLTSGTLPANPSELLGSAAMARLVRQMTETYDIVIIDSPPLVSVSDPSALATLVSGVLLVASADGRLHRDQLRQSLENLSFVKAKLLGLALNRVGLGRKGHSYYGYGPEDQSRRGRRAQRARKKSGDEAAERIQSRRATYQTKTEA